MRRGKHVLSVLELIDGFPSVGADVYVVGNPLGLQQSVSRGIVSAIRCAGDLEQFGFRGRKKDCFVQLDAAINPGSSGGPIVDDSGKVAAMSSAAIQGAQGMNFGVPAAYVSELLDLAGKCKPLEKFFATAQRQSQASSQPASTEGSREMTGAQLGFADAIVRLYTLVGIADGGLSDFEAEQMSIVASEWGVTPLHLQVAGDNLRRDIQRRDVGELAAEAAAFLGSTLSDAQQEAVLGDLIRIAEADGANPNEVMVINAVAELWGFE